MKVQQMKIGDLKPYSRNARTHSPKQIEEIARSIKVFGFTNPVLIDQNNMIIAGHGRVMAAKELGLDEVPTLCIDYLSNAEKRAYILADNKLAEKAGWDKEILAIELQELMVIEDDFDITLTGFETPEIDFGGNKIFKSSCEFESSTNPAYSCKKINCFIFFHSNILYRYPIKIKILSGIKELSNS